MKNSFRLPALAGVLAAAFCLATLTPPASSEAFAQWIRSPVVTQTYYGNGWGYNNAYGNGYGGYGTYGTYSNGYSGYGNGPYVYGAPAMYTYPSNGGYGYRTSASYNTYYGGVPYNNGTYRPIYNPNVQRYYSPYGYGAF